MYPLGLPFSDFYFTGLLTSSVRAGHIGGATDRIPEAVSHSQYCAAILMQSSFHQVRTSGHSWFLGFNQLLTRYVYYYYRW